MKGVKRNSAPMVGSNSEDLNVKYVPACIIWSKNKLILINLNKLILRLKINLNCCFGIVLQLFIIRVAVYLLIYLQRDQALFCIAFDFFYP